MLWWTSRQLKADDWKLREAAAKKLGEAQDAQSIEALVSTLKDTNARVRQAAVGALVRIGHPAVKSLNAALRSKNSDTRHAAASALANIGDPAVSALGTALHDRDLNVREIAAVALGDIATAPAMDHLLSALDDGDSGAKESAAAGLLRIGPKTIRPLIGRLSNSNPRVRETAAAALVRAGKAAIDPLIAALDDAEIREAAMEVLWKIDANWSQLTTAKSAIPGVIGSLKEGDEGVRRAAATALGRIGDSRGLDPLLAALADRNIGVQEAAATALGEIGDPRALMPLVSALKIADNKTRKAVAAAIVRIGNNVVQPLVAILKNKEAPLREAAAAVLVRIGHSVVEPLVDALWKIDPDWAKGEEVNPAVPHFVSALKDVGSSPLKDPKEILRKVGQTRVIKPLAATLKDTQTGAAKTAMSVGQVKSSRDVETLSQALGNLDSAVRKSALDALLEIGRNSEGPLTAALISKNHVVRRAAAHTLAERGDTRARDVLRCDLMDCTELVTLDAAESLLKIGDVVIVQPLLKILKQPANSPTDPASSCSHATKRIHHLMFSLLEGYAQKLELEDLEAIAGIHSNEKDRFVASADLKSEEPESSAPSVNRYDSDGAVSWSQIADLARRELNRRRVKTS